MSGPLTTAPAMPAEAPRAGEPRDVEAADLARFAGAAVASHAGERPARAEAKSETGLDQRLLGLCKVCLAVLAAFVLSIAGCFAVWEGLAVHDKLGKLDGFARMAKSNKVSITELTAKVKSSTALDKKSSGGSSGLSSLQPNSAILTWDSEPKAGGTSRGTLKVPLDYEHSHSPMLELKVTMIFSEIQPAPHGALFTHPGGPGSDDTDLIDHPFFVFPGYDVWSISQRGIGPDATPSLQCTGAHLPAAGKSAPFKISDFTDCPCALPDDTPMLGEAWADIDPHNATQVEHLFHHMMRRSKACYASARFQLAGANGANYNFLDYVGTHLLARDVDRFREAIGAKTMSMRGISYGTLVAATYATAFPSRTGRVLLDGNMAPLPLKEELATGCADGMSRAVAKLLRDCRLFPSKCSLVDPEAEYNQIMQDAREGKLTAPTELGREFPLSVGMLNGWIQKELADNSGYGWTKVYTILSYLRPSNLAVDRQFAVGHILDSRCFINGTATWSRYGICVGPGSVAQRQVEVGGDELAGDAFIEQTAVLGADLAGRFLLTDSMALWRAVAMRHGETGLGAFVGIMAALHDWPAIPTPLAPLGNPSIHALIIGNLYDPSTSYQWSQRMRQAFPAASMLTWQGVGHGQPLWLDGYDQEAFSECFNFTTRYFLDGHLPIDGHVCRQRAASGPLA